MSALELGGASVAILGWAGSTERHLRPIARWYRDHGGEPIVHCANVPRAMSHRGGWLAEGRRLAAKLEATAGPIVVHVFSNAGFWTWAATLDALSPATRERIEAAVIDSAPGLPRRVSRGFFARYGAMGLMPMVLRALRRPPALRHPVLTPAVETFLRVWYHVSPSAHRFSDRSLVLVREHSRWPHLFLYSTADSLVRHTLVEDFIDTLGDTERLRWDDSEHVMHLFRHRQAYLDAVAGFLSRHLDPGAR